MVRLQFFLELMGGGIVQSVQRLLMGWTAEVSASDSWQGQDVSLLRVVQTVSAAHHACYPMGTEGIFPGCKAAGV
jgi:hypothetical protein